ncbi:MAG: hypothetical protein QW103_00820 [Candidatus Pacearchaeota archaeon]
MNDLTGAFLYALERGIEPNLIKQSFINTGYSIKEIEEAYMEAKQVFSINQIKYEEKKSNKPFLLIILIFIIIFLILGLSAWYFLFEGKDSKFVINILEKLKITKE